MNYIFYPTPTPNEARAMNSEIAKVRHLASPYLDFTKGPVADIGTQGVPVVPYAIQLDLPRDQALKYSGDSPEKGPIQLRGSIENLPFDDRSMWAICLSHIIEDWSQDHWPRIVGHVASKVMKGGCVLIFIPDQERWWHQVYKEGRTHNFSHHQPQPSLGDIRKLAHKLGLICEREEYTDLYEWDSTIFGVLRIPL